MTSVLTGEIITTQDYINAVELSNGVDQSLAAAGLILYLQILKLWIQYLYLNLIFDFEIFMYWQRMYQDHLSGMEKALQRINRCHLPGMEMALHRINRRGHLPGMEMALQVNALLLIANYLN